MTITNPVALSYRVAGRYRFTVKAGKPENPDAARLGTKLSRGANFRCLMSDTPIPSDHIYREAMAGRMGTRLMAVVAEGERERVYLPPTGSMESVARAAEPEWAPDLRMPENPRWFSPPLYGLTTYGDLFTSRQLVAMTTFADLVREARTQVENDAIAAGLASDPASLAEGGMAAAAYADAVSIYLAFAVSRLANRSATICIWNRVGAKIEQVFARQAIPMTWDFAEGNVLSDSTGSWSGSLEWIPEVLEMLPSKALGSVRQANATARAEGFERLISTDPPY